MIRTTEDRNFDDLAQKFKRKVYGGLKGEIRLAVIWRDLCRACPLIESGDSLRVLDIGGGLAQVGIRLAALGHQVTVNDISAEMLSLARQEATLHGLEKQINWIQAPYQILAERQSETFDLVLCHALMEWLAEPQKLLRDIRPWIADGGLLSLTFYNRNSLIYRNLVRGNFNLLRRSFKADPGSLTPLHPQDPDEVKIWLADSGLRILDSSGIRVFRDYVGEARGGNAIDPEVLDMELRYSELEPFKWLGRYIHFICA